MRLSRWVCLAGAVMALIAASKLPAAFAASSPSPEQIQLTAFLEEVYQAMDAQYYRNISRPLFEVFVREYTAEKLKALNDRTHKTENYFHLGAGLLVEKLKNPQDRFTNFIPPVKVAEFKQKAYAVTHDLGLRGERVEKGYRIIRVEKHSDAFKAGIEPGFILLRLGGRDVAKLTDEEIHTLLNPEEGVWTDLEFVTAAGQSLAVRLESKTYFVETVYPFETDVPGVFIFGIQHFNQMTAPDFKEELQKIGLEKIRFLILDLRGNEGGPPLAARELLGFFLPPNDPLFALAKKKQRPMLLTAPEQGVFYDGPLAVLVNEKTGSAAETLSGVLQAKKRSELWGQTTAGAAYLKGLHDFEDGSALFMITSLTYYFNRNVFPDKGLTPDVITPPEQDTVDELMTVIRRHTP